jgi:tRNA-dihydrouridine synthase 2
MLRFGTSNRFSGYIRPSLYSCGVLSLCLHPCNVLNYSQSKYLDNVWGLTKYCANQFKGTRLRIKKTEAHNLHQRLCEAKGYDAVADISGPGTGEDDFREIEQAISSRPGRFHAVTNLADEEDQEEGVPLSTPPERENPEPPSLNAPREPTHPLRMTIPAGVSGHDAPTPTPGGGIPSVLAI